MALLLEKEYFLFDPLADYNLVLVLVWVTVAPYLFFSWRQ
jgi:hypothetical protein